MSQPSRFRSRCDEHRYSSIWWRSGRRLVRDCAGEDEDEAPPELQTFELIYLSPFWGLIDTGEIKAPDSITAVALASETSERDFPLHEVIGPTSRAVKILDEEQEPMEARVLVERDGVLSEEVVVALTVGMAAELAVLYAGPGTEVVAISAGMVTQWRVEDPEVFLTRDDLPEGWVTAA